MSRVANDLPIHGEVLPDALPVSAQRPGVALRHVLRLEALRGSRVLAGKAGLDRPVSRINVMEVPDVLPWVRPGELLVTTGYAVREEPERLADLVRGLDAAGAAALGIKLGRYLDRLPRAVLRAAEELGFPVVSLPDSASYDDLITAVLTAVLDHQADRLQRSEQAHRALVRVVLAGGGLPEVAQALAAILDVTVAVTTADGRVVAEAAGSADTPRARAEHYPQVFTADGRFRVEGRTCGLGHHPAPAGPGGHAVVPIVAGSLDHGRILALSDRRRLGDVDVQALERAATVCALVITKALAVTAVESKYQADFLRDLLVGRDVGPERAVPHARGLGWDVERPVVVLVAEPDQQEGAAAPAQRGLELRPHVERLAAAWSGVVRARDGAAAVVGFTTEVVAVVGVPVGGDIERVVRDIVAGVRGDSGGGRRPFSVGVSRVAADVTGIAAAYDQARKALAVGRQVHGPGAVASFDRLGVHRLLSLVSDPQELRSFAREALGELVQQTPQAADLRHTLQVLLDTNLNVAQAARELHFHYNTLRYRIAKLERLLGPFTVDPLLRLDLALALRVVAMRGIAAD